MDQEEANTSNTAMQKRRHSDDDNEAGPRKVVAADPPNPTPSAVKQTGDIFKLDIDCYEEAFDYLTIEDLVNVGKTCKRLQQVAGYCFQQNYLGSAEFSSDGIRSNDVDVKQFVPFFRKIRTDVDGLWYVLDIRSHLRRLKQICFRNMESIHMNRLKDLSMPNLEVLRIDECELSNDFNHQLWKFIDHCAKLKRLEINFCTIEFDWIDRKYPTLEYFKIDLNGSIEGIPKFLTLNPNIRKFATDEKLLWEHRDKFMLSNVELDDLAIYSFYCFLDDDKPVYNLLNALHERVFYKKLQLYFSEIDRQDQIDRLATIKGLVKLHVGKYSTIYPLFSALKNLQEIFVDDRKYVADLEILPENLNNLKYIHFKKASINDIMPFVRRSVEIQRIKVDRLDTGIHFNADTGIINLLALNREREPLPDAEKITMFVEEEVYLATKWAMKGNDFPLIRLNRKDSFDWVHDFETL